MCNKDDYLVMIGGRGYGVDPDNKTLYIGNNANCGLYCNIGHGLYQSFVYVMNSNITKRGWNVVFSDMAAWGNHSADGQVLKYLFDTYDNAAVNIPENNKIMLAHWGTNALQTTSTLKDVNKYFSACFKTNSELINMQEWFYKKYNLCYEETLAVCHRGTNKWTECASASTQAWLDKAKKVLKDNPHLNRVLLQTDQEQMRDAFLAEFGASCFFFEEIAATTGKMVMHAVTKKEEKLKHTKNIHAAVYILAKHNYLINHAGNTGYAIAAYRGTAKNMWQFNCQGECTPPDILHDVPDNA